MNESDTQPEPKPKPFETKPSKWYLTIWAVFAWIAVLGPLALPFLWKSPAFSLFWKWVITIGLTILTVMLTWSTIELIKLTLEHFKKAGLI